MSEPTQEPSAYDLLSKPTLSITDAEAEAIVVDLRRRRQLYTQTGKADKPAKPKDPAAPKAKPTSAQKAAATAALLASLELKL